MKKITIIGLFILLRITTFALNFSIYPTKFELDLLKVVYRRYI